MEQSRQAGRAPAPAWIATRTKPMRFFRYTASRFRVAHLQIPHPHLCQNHQPAHMRAHCSAGHSRRPSDARVGPDSVSEFSAQEHLHCIVVRTIRSFIQY